MRGPFLVAVLSSLTLASYFPPKPVGITTIKSKLQPGVSISYKQTHICETTAGVKSYSGYVHLPASVLQDSEGPEHYNLNTFFWFFESRHSPQDAPFAIYLAGGPGESSMFSAVDENGPCYINKDSNSTTLNPWSLNNYANVLYIDQPNMSGFSYSSLINATINLVDGTISKVDAATAASFKPNQTVTIGTFPNQDPGLTANTTMNGARALWHFVQNWFETFPEYTPKDPKLSLWSNSYGGFYGPAYVAYFLEQNKAPQYGGQQLFEIDALGITNGCTDVLVNGPLYPNMAYNNTYGLKAYNETIYKEAKHNYSKKNGCKDLVEKCRKIGEAEDPLKTGSNTDVNNACAAAVGYCFQNVLGAYAAFSGRSNFDIAHKLPDPYPYRYPVGFFNQRWVQEALGVPVNFTYVSSVVAADFLFQTGDTARQTIDELNKVLQADVKVALIFGDRDYQCNWLGGEATSLQATYPSAAQFRKAGYTSLRLSNAHPRRSTVGLNAQGGLVRQHDTFSFTRVFNAGHAVGAYQPETVWTIFNRTLAGRDVATGTRVVSKDYSTSGMASAFGVKNVLPKSPPVLCYVLDVAESCTDEQIAALKKGTAVIKDFVVVEPVGRR